MSEARRRQIEALRRMTPAQRYEIAAKMIRLAHACRDARLRRQNPGVTEEEFKRIRDIDALGHDPWSEG